MVTDKIKQLADYQNKIVALQKDIDKERAGALAHLHERFGFATPQELIKAIRAAAGGTGRGAGRKARRHRKHARITTEMKEKIKAALQAGKSGSKVADEFGISLPSVYNIKKAFGLVKTRKKK
jgi:DNA invertase Pin-like site-specific DNA recombinase